MLLHSTNESDSDTIGGVSSSLMTWLSPSSFINRFQNQCCFHTLSTISSMGMFFVSGRKKRTKSDMMATQMEKNTNMKDLRWQSIERKTCARMDVKSRFVQTLTLCPAERVSSGKVSLGMSHPSGPHDQAKEDTKLQMMMTTMMAQSWPRWSERSVTLVLITTAMATNERNICTPASSSNIRLPTRSTVYIDTNVDNTFTAPVITAE